MTSKKLCEFWKADRYGEGKGACYAAGDEGNIVCLTEGELGGKLIPDCMSYPFGITADRDRERAAKDAAEKRVADLERKLAAANEDAARLAEALGYAATFCAGYIHGADNLAQCGGCRTGKCDDALRAHEARKEGT